MRSVPKLVRRFIGILLLSIFLLFVLNVLVLFYVALNQSPSGSPYTTAETAAKAVFKTDDGYAMDKEMLSNLLSENIWAILIDEKSKSVVWKTNNTPESIPDAYSLSDISSIATGYLNGYPTYTGEAMSGLLVLGYPKNSYWKHLWPSWDFDFIANLPKTVLAVLFVNLLLVTAIYMISAGRFVKSVKPIVQGIQDLPDKKEIKLKEKGVLSELAVSINQTSLILRQQEQELQKKEKARANWIAGVSHDIRTPLSMVMGYAGQLEGSPRLAPEERKKVKVIIRQSEKIRNLINDLNLASKLEYNMQPLNLKKTNAVALVRQVAVDFINNDVENKYPIKWMADENLPSCIIEADEDLIKRAVTNLIQNCINHNESGCTIYISVRSTEKKCIIAVEDDGVGASAEQFERLNTIPHYMMGGDSGDEQRHGLGLLIVKQVMHSHNGKMAIGQSRYGGFAVTLEFPKV